MRSILGTTIISDIDNEYGHVVKGSVESIGSGLPTTANAFAYGCEIVDKSNGIVWTNIGTVTAPVWGGTGVALVTLAPTDIVATGTGQLSSTNGLTIVPAAPAGYVNVWHRTIVSYTYATAAYTGGGNTTVNIAGGGAALSGLIATTTLWQNGSSIIQEFVPLSTVAFPITTATAISLKTASAITQPGTAAGTAKVYSWYSVVAI